MTEKKSTVVVTTFVSNDGVEFKTKAECLEHERWSAAFLKRKAIVSELPHFIYTPAWVDPDFTWDWYYVSNAEEFNAVREVLFAIDASAFDFVVPGFPCWIACWSDSEGYGNIEGTLDQISGTLERLSDGIRKEAEGTLKIWNDTHAK